MKRASRRGEIANSPATKVDMAIYNLNQLHMKTVHYFKNTFI